MFAALYRFKLQPHQEEEYRACWRTIVKFYKEKCGALGSCLHKEDAETWVAYSRWPSKAHRDKVWDNGIPDHFPAEIKAALQKMLAIKEENALLGTFNEVCLEVVEDKLIGT